MIETLQEWSDQFVGADVRICAAPVADLLAGLTETEMQAVASSVEIRQHTYSTGRFCAKAALGLLDIPPTEYPEGLVRQSDGSVNWPDGSLGSISHTNDWAVAAVARTGGQYASIGIDLEQIDRVDARVLKLIATDEERAYLQANSTLRWGRVGLFSIKESLYKCLRPLYGEFINFKDVQLSALDRLSAQLSPTSSTVDLIDHSTDNQVDNSVDNSYANSLANLPAGKVIVYQPTIELLEPKLAACCRQESIEARVAILNSHVLSFVSYSQ